MTMAHPVSRFAVLRHARTEWNTEKRIQGQLDSPLTAHGRSQARFFAERILSLGVTAILCSDLGRTLQTATIINDRLNLPLHPEKRLREQDWGRWSGKTLAAIEAEEGAALDRQVAAGWKFCAPGGEDRRSVYRRGCRALESWAVGSRHRRTLVVTHEGMLKCLIYGLSGRKFLPPEPPLIRSDHLHWLVYADGALQIENLNALDLTPEGDS